MVRTKGKQHNRSPAPAVRLPQPQSAAEEPRSFVPNDHDNTSSAGEGASRRYFEGDKGFTPNHTATLTDEFERYADMKRWGQKRRRAEKMKACAQEFEYLVGQYSSVHHRRADLEQLQLLCTALDIKPVPESKTKCKEAIQRVHVNIHDCVNCMRAGTLPVKPIFANRQRFLRHTIDNDLIFPKRYAKNNQTLKLLLEHVFS